MHTKVPPLSPPWYVVMATWSHIPHPLAGWCMADDLDFRVATTQEVAVSADPMDTPTDDVRATGFPALLQELREAHRLSQSELAKRMGRDPSTISLLENKRRRATRRLI